MDLVVRHFVQSVHHVSGVAFDLAKRLTHARRGVDHHGNRHLAIATLVRLRSEKEI